MKDFIYKIQVFTNVSSLICW